MGRDTLVLCFSAEENSRDSAELVLGYFLAVTDNTYRGGMTTCGKSLCENGILQTVEGTERVIP